MPKKIPSEAKRPSFPEALADIQKRVAQMQLERERQRKRKLRKRTYKYLPYLISYLDVLGMKDLLNESGEDANKVAEVLGHFRDCSTPMDDQKKLWKSAFVNFSDLGLRILPILTLQTSSISSVASSMKSWTSATFR